MRKLYGFHSGKYAGRQNQPVHKPGPTNSGSGGFSRRFGLNGFERCHSSLTNTGWKPVPLFFMSGLMIRLGPPSSSSGLFEIGEFRRSFRSSSKTSRAGARGAQGIETSQRFETPADDAVLENDDARVRSHAPDRRGTGESLWQDLPKLLYTSRLADFRIFARTPGGHFTERKPVFGNDAFRQDRFLGFRVAECE